MRILIINGPNLNLLGQREPEVYGSMDYQTLEEKITAYAKDLSIDVEIRQTNFEGIILDLLHHAQNSFDAIILNAAALTHYAYALYDGIKAINKPVVEVHLSDPKTRKETFRHTSVIEDACIQTFKGKHIDSYFEALDYLKNHFNVQ